MLKFKNRRYKQLREDTGPLSSKVSRTKHIILSRDAQAFLPSIWGLMGPEDVFESHWHPSDDNRAYTF